jgi:hypothetical protein
VWGRPAPKKWLLERQFALINQTVNQLNGLIVRQEIGVKAAHHAEEFRNCAER